MTPRRLSKRTSAVKKRRLLEEKLNKRKEAADFRLLKARSKALRNLLSEELDSFQEEALRLGQLVDSLDPSHPDSEDSENSADQSFKSLEWDNSGESPPSFLTDRSSSLPDRTQSVDEIVHDILDLGIPADCQEEPLLPDLSESGYSARRNTSTDNQFLDQVPPVGAVPELPKYQWPPKFPSEEPDNFHPFDSSSLHQDLDPVEDLEVFETDLPEPSSKMEEEDYKLRFRTIKIAKAKVKDIKKTFLATNVTNMDISTYGARLEKIRDKLEEFQDIVTDLIVDLDENDATDQARIVTLEASKEELLQEVLLNETEVKQKVEQMLVSQPITKAEQETIDLKKKQLENSEEEKRTAKVEKKTKVEIDMEDVIDRATTLMENLSSVEAAKDLTDLQVREYLAESKRWESKVEDIIATKVKIDKDLVGLDVAIDSKNKLNEAVSKSKEILKAKLADLKKVDSERGLFSLSKPAGRENAAAVYPEAFSGKKGEDVYKFKKKFVEALTANQVPEKNKVEFLRKYLKGNAKLNLGDHYETFDAAMNALVDNYGQAEVIWDAKIEHFVENCNKSSHWSKLGSEKRRTVINLTCEFLREAEKLSKDHPELESAIYSSATVKKVILVLPPEMSLKIAETGGGHKLLPKQKMKEIRTFLERQQAAELDLSKYSEELNQSQINFGSVHSFDKQKNRKVNPNRHECSKSASCKTDWGMLGCSLTYKLDTVPERRQKFRKANVCYKCGRVRKTGSHTLGAKPTDWVCLPKSTAASQHAVCKDPSCNVGAALCARHAPNNAQQELLDWITKNQIKTTVNTMLVSPVSSTNLNATTLLPPGQLKFSKAERNKLQAGEMCVPFSNEQLKDFFVKDLKNKGHFATRDNVIQVPEGDIAFVFCKIKGKHSGIQAFIDSGANCCIMADGVPQRELNSCKLQDGPISIDVATGIVVHASGEWGSALPLSDGSHQLLRGLTVPRVTSDMPRMRLEPWFEKVKSIESDNEQLQEISIPKELGGHVDMILGISFSLVHPEPIHTFSDGLTIYKSKFLPMNPGELACIGGPMASINSMVQNVGARSTIRHLCNFLSDVSAGWSPRLEFFPSSFAEMERTFDIYADKGIPCLEEYLDAINKTSDDSTDDEVSNSVDDSFDEYFSVDESPEEPVVNDAEDEEPVVNDAEDEEPVNNDAEDEVPEQLAFNDAEDEAFEETTVNDEDESEVPGIACDDCGEVVLYQYQCTSVQTELKRFLQQQEAGLDCSFRCMRCRQCRLCLKGAGEERKSMMQEAHQEIIRQSVHIDKELGRAVAKLPFVSDPAGKLNNNTRLATKRLENVCRKYGGDVQVKEMINHSFKKLFDRGHIAYLEDLPDDVKQKIKNATTSYTIPYDVAFKEGSISTPARPVFDASAKTPGGESLNNLLAKGSPDMVRLIDMVLDWRMGPSALTGDIRQFYNCVLLDQDHWQYQKILLKKNLDPNAKILTAIIKTLIYGVKPVGNQCDEVIKLLADEIWEEFPEVAVMLVKKRYVDDFGQSTPSREATEDLIKKTNDALAKIKMEVKGWVVAGKAPPPEASEDGLSVGFAGLTWFPFGDMFKLNIQSLHFAKKKRGKFPADLVKFDQSSGISIEQFTPQHITRTNCTSVTARIFDITGLLAPVTLKMKHHLRKLISHEPSWTKPIPDHQRATWVNLFKTVEDIRDILYLRCTIPVDAISCKARVLLLADAADVGIILGAYVCYEKPGQVWSCDLLFGKGLLAHENWTIPSKELHGLSALSNLKVILENCLTNWIQSFHAFSDSEIALCWAIYERVKLTTFVRNRVINIRTKMGLDILHHVEGKHNPCDVGTRPELITADSVRPGSIWLSGCDWMKGSLEKARQAEIIKSVEDIKLTNEKKKSFKEGIAYEAFDEVEQGIFAVAQVGKIDEKKMTERLSTSKYIYPPLKRSFKALVRITALVILAKNKFKKLLIRKKMKRGEVDKSELEKLDYPPPKFSVFNYKVKNNEAEAVSQTSTNESLTKYFGVDGSNSVTADHTKPVKWVKLNEEHLSAALDYLFRKATEEVLKFNHKKEIDKIATMHDGILLCNSRLLEAAELRVVGHLSENINIEQFTGVNFRVPLVDQHSPLGISIAMHLHYNKFPHRGPETQYRMSLQFAKILGARKLFNQISADCVYCKKLQKKLLEQIMGPLSEAQLSISPVFFFTLVDLWGPLRSYVPGYEKVTRSVKHTKPHEIYMLVFACCATGTVNCQVIEGKDADYCMDGMNRFFMETTVPKIMYSDEEGGLVKALKYGRVDLVDLAGTLSRQRGISFETVVPQGHSGHGRIEKRIHMLQLSLEQSQIRNSRCTSMGWHTLAKAVERTVNSVPIGFLHHQSGGLNPLLRILTPNSLRLISTSERAPVSLFNIPDNPAGIMGDIEQKYESWYQVWNEQYLPLIMNRKKWHFRKENLCPGDIVYFKLTESKMSACWKVGKVEEVKIGNDGYVRQALIAYKDTTGEDASDWEHRTVDRPVRNIVKLFHIDDTTLMDDITAIHKLSQKILEKEKMSFDDAATSDENPPKSEELQEFHSDKSFDNNVEPSGENIPKSVEEQGFQGGEEEIFDDNIENKDDEDYQDIDEFAEKLKKSRREYVSEEFPIIDDLADQLKKFRKNLPKKRKTELEKLKIEAKGWDMIKKVNEIQSPDHDSLQAVKYSASPFVHNFKSVCENSTVQGDDAKGIKGVYSSMMMGVNEGAEIEDDIFDVIEPDDSAFDTQMQIYML